MSTTRLEKDILGQKEIPANSLYGIHTVRALDNFPLSKQHVHTSLIHAFGLVKLACIETIAKTGHWSRSAELLSCVERACSEMSQGLLDEHIVVDALQGGAGTSLNMNINEVIANRALQLFDKHPGDYDVLSPFDDINRFQSTNDTYPTALKVAAISGINCLEEKLVKLQEAFQEAEKTFADVVKVGRTQYQDAVLITLGREMAAYAEAINRDRWRVYKCVERLRVINLGGTAIGSGLGAPRQYIFQVVDTLRSNTGFGLARAENLVEATQNTDEFVEVSGILKACACTLIKISSDLRLLSSGPEAGIGEIKLPARQAGSSIMPGKINPVIPEAVTQAAIKVISYDQSITQAASLGSLELNPFLPLIADSLLNAIDLLTNGCDILTRLCINGLEADTERCREHIENSTAAITALIDTIGYEKASEIAKIAQATNQSIRQIVVQQQLVTEEAFDQLITPEAVCRLGSRSFE